MFSLQPLGHLALSGTIEAMQMASQCISSVVTTDIGRPITHLLLEKNAPGTNGRHDSSSAPAVEQSHTLREGGVPCYFQGCAARGPSLAMQ